MITRFSKSAGKALLRCNKRQLVREKIEAFARDPEAMGTNVVKLQGREEYRLRVQDWRVVFQIEGSEMLVIDIAPRGSVYEVKK
jgi:mRNA interferase RelE/StbE